MRRGPSLGCSQAATPATAVASVEAHLAAASRFHAQGDDVQAERACEAALREAPHNSIALMMLAELALERKNWQRAIERARRAQRFDQRNALCHFTLGRAFHASGRPAEARLNYAKAVRLRPDFAPGHCNLAIVLLDLGEIEAAWGSGLRAVELDWSLAEAHMTVGRALLQLRHLEQAEAALRAAVKAGPKLGRAYHYLGVALQRLGRFEEAVGYHQQAVVFEPELAEGWSGLGLALRAFGRFNEAIASFRRALDLAPDFGDAHREMAICQRAAASESEVSGMRALLAEEKKPRQQRISAAFGLGKFFDDIGSYDEAFASYAQGNAMCRENAAAQGHIFDAEELRAEIEAAIKTYSAEFFARRAGWGVASDLPVFVVGLFRSGTTLTEQILASHPGVYGAGELPHLQRLLKQLADKPADAAALTSDQVAGCAAHHLAQLQRIGGPTLRVVDKHPQNVFALGLITSMFPRGKIICCHRDARDNVLSCFFQHFTEQMTFATDLVDCGVRYIETERMTAHWREVLPVPIFDLQYEKLVADLEGEARRLIEFIGLDWDPACLSFYETERAVNTPSTWQVRQPIYSSSVGRWRNYERHLGPLLQLLAQIEPANSG
jgi:tetratricopeptide (TPR) repeat protein